MRTIPAGITWERHSRLRSACTIRHEPETIFDWSDYLPLPISLTISQQNAAALCLAGPQAVSRCVCCGQPLSGLGIVGILGGVGL